MRRAHEPFRVRDRNAELHGTGAPDFLIRFAEVDFLVAMDGAYRKSLVSVRFKILDMRSRYLLATALDE